MDFRFSQEEEAWRQTVRAYLAEVLPAKYDTHPDAWALSEDAWELSRRFARAIGEKGWLTAAWPPEYGGLGLSIMRQVILNEELSYHSAPLGRAYMGANMVGPTIIVHGDEEQKRRYLPEIATAEKIWCQGFSEPGAGSDLASLQTRGVVDGDDIVVTGQKIWTSGAHKADYSLLGVRTDPDAPKHRGISLLLVDMRSPGVTVQPILTLDGAPHFCQVFFEQVRVPRASVVGQLNRGWYAMTTTLDFERSGIGFSVGARRRMERVAALWREAPHLFALPPALVRHTLADMAVEIEVMRMLSYRVASLQQAGRIPNYEASINKILGSEMGQRHANAVLNLVGLHGQRRGDGAELPLEGKLPESYLQSLMSTIGAGTSEIQRNIIATRGLGLPR